jgi:hypothetical protein
MDISAIRAMLRFFSCSSSSSSPLSQFCFRVVSSFQRLFETNRDSVLRAVCQRQTRSERKVSRCVFLMKINAVNPTDF